MSNRFQREILSTLQNLVDSEKDESKPDVLSIEELLALIKAVDWIKEFVPKGA